MSKSFDDTVADITKQYGTKGFTAKKTAASDVLGEDIGKVRGTLSDGPESIAVASVLDNLEIAQRELQNSQDPQATKQILTTVKDLKQVVKNLGKEGSKDLNEGREKQLNQLINKTEKNVKKASKSGGAFGKANQNFLGSLTETLNPLSAMGDFFGTAGIAPLEGYFNSLGDSLNDKVKGALGLGASEESQNMTREIQKDKKAQIETEFADKSEDNASVLTKEGTTSTAGQESSPGMKASDILVPEMSLMKRTSIRLGRALGLTDQSGKSYLEQIFEVMKGDPASRSEKPEGGGDDIGAVPEEPEQDGGDGKKKKGGIFGMLSGLVGGGAAGVGAGIKGLAMGIRSLGMAVMTLANPIALVGLAAFTAAVIGIGFALKLAAPAIKVFADAIVGIAKVIGKTFVKVMEKIPPIMESIGGVITSIGDAISNVVSTVFDGLATTIERLADVDVKNLGGLAIALFALAPALAAFGAGSGIGAIISGFGGLFGDGPLDQIQKIDGKNIQNAADGIDRFGSALKKLDKDIESFGSSNAPEILKNFTQTMSGFTEAMPSAFEIGKMAAFGLSFSSLQSTAKDFVENMTIIADPTAPAQTNNLNDAQRAAGSSSGASSSNNIAVNNGGNVQNVNTTTNNTTTNASPQHTDFDYYAFRSVNVHA
jgi:hypothetical protein